MFNILHWFYRRIIRIALDNGLINKENAIRLYNILKYEKPTCELCRKPLKHKTTIDHILPRSKGGADTFENSQLAHRGCNRFKGNRIIRRIKCLK